MANDDDDILSIYMKMLAVVLFFLGESCVELKDYS